MMEVFHWMEGCKFGDVSMLVSEFIKGADRTIPIDHPDYENFDTTCPFVSHQMDIVFCDGIVLRTHERAS